MNGVMFSMYPLCYFRKISRNLLSNRRFRAMAGSTLPSRGLLVVIVGSRVLALALAVAADVLLPDHQATDVLVWSFDSHCHSAWLLRAFSRWDSAHMLSCAQDGWREEWQQAFFPGYPLLVRAAATALTPLSSLLCEQERLVVGGILSSNLCFVIAACALHALSSEVFPTRPRLTHKATVLFSLSPASVFFSSCYSESAFAALTFSGLLLYERRRLWLGVLTLAAATCFRANGTLGALFVLFHGLARAAKQPRATAALAVAIVTFMQCALVTSPYVAWQQRAYRRYCVTPTLMTGEGAHAETSPSLDSQDGVAAAGGGDLLTPPPWCASRLPDLYAHVQSTHWNVGFLRAYELKQLPNFALAAPALALCACATVATCAARKAEWRAKPANGWRQLLLRPSAPRADDGPALTAAADIHVLHWLLLSTLGLFVMNVQVTTRLVGASCAPYYWYMAHLLSSPVLERRWQRAIVVYVVGYAIGGTMLHVNFLPFV